MRIMRIGLSIAVIVLILVGASITTWYLLDRRASDEKMADARKKLAFESLTERLPTGKPFPPTRALSSEAKKRWEKFDWDLASSQIERANLLKALHERTRRFFVESPGEGSGRRLATPEEILMDDYELMEPLGRNAGWSDQPGKPAEFPFSPSEPLSRVDSNPEFSSYHNDGMMNFLHPSGFGYVKDRQHVAGFKSHGFRYFGYSMNAGWRWRIKHIQLVGILSHVEPVVYLSDKLPSMEQLRQGKTRPPDFFEEVALPALRDGEDLFIIRKEDTIRMMGALRATKTCQQCHDAEIGDLLGAMSYTLRLAPAETKR